MNRTRTLVITSSYVFLSLFLPLSAFIGIAVSYDKVYLYHVLVCLCILYAAINFRKLKPFESINKLNSVFLILSLWLVSSFFWIENTATYFKFNIQYVLGILCFYFIHVFIRDQKSYNRVLKLLSYAFIVHVMISLLEAFTKFRLPISPMSKFISFFRHDQSLIQNLSYPSFYEHYPTSFFWHPNNLALVTICSLPLFLNNEKIKPLLKLLLWILTCVIIVKAGAKAMLVIFVIYSSSLIYKVINKYQNIKKFFLPITFLTIISGTLLWISLHPKQKHETKQSFITFSHYASVLPKFISNEFFNTEFKLNFHGGTSERFAFMGAAISAYKENPFLGIGAGQLYGKTVQWKKKNVALNSIHNYWLEMLVIGGPLFLILYLSWYFYLIYRLFASNNRTQKSFAECLILFFFAAPVMSSVLYFFPKWLLYGLASKSLNIEEIKHE